MDPLEAQDPAFVDNEDLPATEVNLEKLREWTLPNLKMVHVRNLKWDKKKQWGQIRRIKENLVEYYRRRLDQSVPRQPIRILVRDMGNGMFLTSTENLRNIFHVIQTRTLQCLVDSTLPEP